MMDYWPCWAYMFLWLAISVLFEKLQRRHYLRRGKRDD